jgi:hypothetical protein
LAFGFFNNLKVFLPINFSAIESCASFYNHKNIFYCWLSSDTVAAALRAALVLRATLDPFFAST